MIQIAPLKTTAEFEDLIHKAKGDNHSTLWPTHLAREGKEIVGYLSMCKAPIVSLWLHSQKVKVRDSLHILSIIETLAQERGFNQAIIPCASISPLLPYMEGFGFTNIGDTKLFIKNL